MASRCLQDAFKMHFCFHFSFDIVLYRFLTQLGPNLPPTWYPKPSQIPPKINKKSIWKDDEIFGGILEASWWHLGGILETFGGIWSENKKKVTEVGRLEAVGGWAVGSMRGTLSICVCICFEV